MLQFNLEKSDCEEFLEVYKGVVNEYGDMVCEMSSGTCVALEIDAQGDPAKFRAFVGPADPVSPTLALNSANQLQPT